MFRIALDRIRSNPLPGLPAPINVAVPKSSCEQRPNRLWDSFSSVVAGPLLRKIGQRNAEILAKHQFQHLDINTTVGQVHAVRSTAGSGVGAAIFVHGLSSSAASNAPILSTLMGFFDDVAAIDLMGHGDNAHVDEVDLERLQRGAYEAIRTIAAIQRGPVTLFGHSMGAYLVLDIGCDIDARHWISSVVAGSPPGAAAASDDERREAVQLFRMEQKGHAFAVGRRACPEFSSALLPVVAAVAWQRFRRPSVQTVVRSNVAACELHDERLRQIQVPTLLCWGERDGLVPIQHMRHLTDVMPERRTRVVTSPNIGHANFVDNAPIFVEGIAAFLKTVDGIDRRPLRRRNSMRVRIDALRERFQIVTLAELRTALQG